MAEIPVDCSMLGVVVPDGHDPSRPLPLLLKRDEVNPNLWATGDGRRVYREREWAEKAMHMNTQAYRDDIRKRAAASHLVHAVEVENWSGWVTLTGDEDDYHESVDALIERKRDEAAWSGVAEADIADHLPAWCFCTTENGFDFDLNEAIHSYLSDNHHEDAADWIDGWGELDAFWKAWSGRQSGLCSYFIDYKHVVVIDRRRFETEREVARAFLAEAG